MGTMTGRSNAAFPPIAVWGKHAEWVAEMIASGMLVLIDGRLKWQSSVDRQGQKSGRLLISAWQVSIVGTPAAISANEGSAIQHDSTPEKRRVSAGWRRVGPWEHGCINTA